MKAVYFPSPDAVEIGALPDPVAGPGEVVVRVVASGICHTDIEVMRGNYGTSTYPLIPGHEFAGEIAEIGAGVTGLSLGDRVVIDPNLNCGTCGPCRRGWAHLCETLGAYGVTVNGGFAEYCAVRADAVHPIRDMDYATAALAEPMGCVLNGLSPLEGRIVERAAIIGAGPIGLLMGLALKARGTGEVIMVDLDADRLRMAQEMGLTGLKAGPEADAELRRTCDLAVDATGVPSVAEGLVDRIANGGAALFFGVCPPEARIQVSPFEIFRRQLSLFGTHSLNHNIPEALAVLAAMGPLARRVVTHQLPADAIPDVMSGRAGLAAMKVQMTA